MRLALVDFAKTREDGEEATGQDEDGDNDDDVEQGVEQPCGEEWGMHSISGS